MVSNKRAHKKQCWFSSSSSSSSFWLVKTTNTLQLVLFGVPCSNTSVIIYMNAKWTDMAFQFAVENANENCEKCWLTNRWNDQNDVFLCVFMNWNKMNKKTVFERRASTIVLIINTKMLKLFHVCMEKINKKNFVLCIGLEWYFFFCISFIDGPIQLRRSNKMNDRTTEVNGIGDSDF